MSEELFARLRMAYMRGAAWREENGSLDLVEKASYDYADKETSPLTENYREPGEFGEGATVRRAEPDIDYRTCGTAELAAANPNVMSYVREREDEIERLKRAAARAEFEKIGILNVIKHHTGFDHGVMGIRSLVDKVSALEAVLRKIAAYDDAAANAYLRATGSYRCFDEPKAVKMARCVLESNK